MDSIRQVELWWVQGWDGSCAIPAWDGAGRTGGTAATLPAPICCAPQLGSAMAWGLGWWLLAPAQTRWLPLVPLTPHLPQASHYRLGGAGGSKGGHWGCCGSGFVLLRVSARLGGTQSPPYRHCRDGIQFHARSEGDGLHQHLCLGSPCVWGELGWPLTAAGGPPSCPGLMLKAAVPREGLAAGTSRCEQMASRCVTCHHWALPRGRTSSEPQSAAPACAKTRQE